MESYKRGARCLVFGLNFVLFTYFVYTSREGSDVQACVQACLVLSLWLLTDALSLGVGGGALFEQLNMKRARQMLCCLLYSTTLKSVKYYVIPSIQKIPFKRPSVYPSVSQRIVFTLC